LAYSNIYSKSGGREVIPQVIGFSTNEVVCEEVDNSDIEFYLLKDANEEAMIEKGEELSDVKYKGASSVVLDPP